MPPETLASLIFRETQELHTLLIFLGRGKYITAGGEGMPILTDIPLNATSEPCIKIGKVASLETCIAIQQFSVIFFVDKTDQSSPKRWEKGRLEIIVLHDDCRNLLLFSVSIVAVLDLVRKRALAAIKAHKSSILRRDLWFNPYKGIVLRVSEGRKWIGSIR
jgi:hypothetical protein